MSLAAFCEQFGLTEPEASSHTIEGYVMEQLGRLAQINDMVVLDQMHLHVEALEGRRVARLRVEKRPVDLVKE